MEKGEVGTSGHTHFWCQCALTQKTKKRRRGNIEKGRRRGKTWISLKEVAAWSTKKEGNLGPGKRSDCGKLESQKGEVFKEETPFLMSKKP